MSAKGIFEQVIARGGFDLTAMLARIDEYHIEGKLDDDERDALYAVARENAKAEYDYAAEIEAIWAAIRELRASVGESSGESDEWPAYQQPTGAHDAYPMGAHVMHGGIEWVSDVDANVWEPGVSGWTQVGGDAG